MSCKKSLKPAQRRELVGRAQTAYEISQRELAKRLNVHESQVSRDERNEYFGVSVERAVKVLDALGVRLRTRIEVEAVPKRKSA